MFFSRKKEEKPTPKPKPGKAKKAEPKAAKQAKAAPAKQAKAEPAKEAKEAPKAAPPAPAKPAAPPKASEIREKLEHGWIRAMIVFELAGKPREHIETTLRAYVVNVKNDGRILSINEEYADAMEHDDGIFSAFVEMEALVQDMETLTWIAINFMPASIEVLEPDRLELESRMIINWYNDLLAKLHEVSNIVREQQAINAHLTEAMNALIKNAILAGVRSSERSAKELEGVVGISAEQLEPFLKNLVEKQRLVLKGSKYALPG